MECQSHFCPEFLHSPVPRHSTHGPDTHDVRAMRAMMLILYAIDIDNRSIKTGENDFIKCGVLSTASSIVKIDDMFHSWRTLFLHRIYLSYQIAKNILEQLLHNNCSTSTHRQNEMKIFSPSQSQSLFLIFRPKLVPSA